MKKSLFSGFIYFVVSWLPAVPAWSQLRPNIIFIMADDLGYGDLACYGSQNIQTPNLDKMAARGMKFTEAYAAAPLCTPTRTAFMTGQYPARTPVGLIEPLDWTAKDSAIGLSPQLPTLPSLLKKQGYENFLVGKWHLGFGPGFSPIKHGFDEFFGYNGGGVDYVLHSAPGGTPDLYENDQPVKMDGYMTTLLEERVIQILNRKHASPFFISLQFSAPHWPWQGPKSPAYPKSNRLWKEGGSKDIYAAMVESMDQSIGRILEVLDKNGLSNNTLVVFTSDNGGERFSDMGILSGRKMLLWEGGIRVPAIVLWPGKVSPGSLSRQPIITMDWTTTFLTLAGVPAKNLETMDGRSLLQAFKKNTTITERQFYWRVSQRNQQKAARQGQWKYLQDEKGEYLFNVQNDPSEKQDLKTREPGIFDQLKNKMTTWESSVLTPVPLSKPD